MTSLTPRPRRLRSYLLPLEAAEEEGPPAAASSPQAPSFLYKLPPLRLTSEKDGDWGSSVPLTSAPAFIRTCIMCIPVSYCVHTLPSVGAVCAYKYKSIYQITVRGRGRGPLKQGNARCSSALHIYMQSTSVKGAGTNMHGGYLDGRHISFC